MRRFDWLLSHLDWSYEISAGCWFDLHDYWRISHLYDVGINTTMACDIVDCAAIRRPGLYVPSNNSWTAVNNTPKGPSSHDDNDDFVAKSWNCVWSCNQ